MTALCTTLAPKADEPYAYRIPDACRMVGLGRTMIYELAATGKLKMVKVAGRTLIPSESLRALIESAERAG